MAKTAENPPDGATPVTTPPSNSTSIPIGVPVGGSGGGTTVPSGVPGVVLPVGSVIVTQAEMDALRSRLAAAEANIAVLQASGSAPDILTPRVRTLETTASSNSTAITALQTRVAKAEASLKSGGASSSSSGRSVDPPPGVRQPNSHFSYDWTFSTYTKHRKGTDTLYNVVCFTSGSIWATRSKTTLLFKCQTFGWGGEGLTLLPRWKKSFDSKKELDNFNFRETITGASYVTWKDQYSSSSLANAAVDAMSSGCAIIARRSKDGYFDSLGWK